MISMLTTQVVRRAVKPLFASISTNIGCHRLAPTTVQDFHEHFWSSVNTRFQKQSCQERYAYDIKANSSPRRVIEEDMRLLMQNDDTDNNNTQAAMLLQQHAREDLFKHYRMKATARAIKRGDGVISQYFSLNEQPKISTSTMKAVSHTTEIPTLTNDAAARRARKDMYHHFWSSHRARIDAAATQILQNHRHSKLPTTLDEVYKMHHNQPRAMAITDIKPPFKIVDVNKAWENLCGYTHSEVVGSTLKELLHGPNTNAAVAKNIVSSLLLDNNDLGNVEEHVLVNYRSDGRQFLNSIQVGRVRNEEGETVNFVGIFRKLKVYDVMHQSNAYCYCG